MSSKNEIGNMALSHLAVGKEVANMESENSEEARALRRFYDIARQNTLRDGRWPFATRIATLALVEEDPNDEWDYSYRYPSGCMRIARILSGIRTDSRQTRVSYKLSGDSQGTLIFTDEEDAEMEYIVDVTNEQMFASDFTLAFSYLLAYMIAPRVTAGDQFKVGEKAFALYQREINKSLVNAFNEEQDDEVPDSEFITERE